MWSILDTGYRDGYMNMAIDEALLFSVKEKRRGPTLRFYGWDPPAISLGFFQSALEEVEVSRLEELGVHMVRRMTGGRLVLHQYELTYTLIIPESLEGIPKGVVPSYALLSKGILQGLKSLGLEVVQKEGRVEKGLSTACFNTPSWYEIQVGVKKIAGSAQVRKEGILLQHGSIPLRLDTDLLFSLIQCDGEKGREREKKRFLRHATAINQELAHEVTYEEVRSALLKGWQETLSFQGEWDELTPEEIEAAERLKREKYSTKEWNLLR